MVEIAVAFITGVLGPILILFVRNILLEKSAPDKLKEAVLNANIINDILDDLLDKYGADRAWIIQFHNGGKYYPTGKSIQKFSMLYETVSNSAYSIKLSLQNIPVNLFSRPLTEILEKDYIYIPDYKDKTIATYGLKDIAHNYNSKSGYMVGIKNGEKLIAVLGIGYINSVTTLSDSQLFQLRLDSSKLEGILISHIED
jgi:hypothetical protein